MATYCSYDELYFQTLHIGDILIFKNIDLKYKVHTVYLEETHFANERIFSKLKISDKYTFCTKAYGYESKKGIFPECKLNDMQALKSVALALFKEYEIQQGITAKYDSPFGTIAVSKDLSSVKDDVIDIIDKINIALKEYPLTSDETIILTDIKDNPTKTLKENENRFQKQSPQVRRGNVPGGSSIRGRKSKTSVECGHLSYRTVIG